MPSKAESQYANNTRELPMKYSNHTRKSSQKNKSGIATKLKFFEINLDKLDGQGKHDYAEITNKSISKTTRQNGHSNVEQNMEEPVYAVVDRSKKSFMKKQENKDVSREDTRKEIRIKHETLRKPKFPVDSKTTFGKQNDDLQQLQKNNIEKQQKLDNSKKPRSSENEQNTNGTYFVMAHQSQNYNEQSNNRTKQRNRSLKTKQNGVSVKERNTEEGITFLSAAEIGNIYQHYPEGLAIPKQTDNPKRVNDDITIKNNKIDVKPKDYHHKMNQSKNALQELRKSLSSEEPLEYLNSEVVKKNGTDRNEKPHTDKENTKIPRISHLVEEHQKVEKQDSNNSSASNVSNSSAISKKLLMLEEANVKKSPHPSPGRSKKMFSKKFIWRTVSGFDDFDMPDKDIPSSTDHKPSKIVEKESTPQIQRKRHTIAAVKYTSADVSPASVRSYRSSISTPVTSQPHSSKPLSTMHSPTRKAKIISYGHTRPGTLNVPEPKDMPLPKDGILSNMHHSPMRKAKTISHSHIKPVTLDVPEPKDTSLPKDSTLSSMHSPTRNTKTISHGYTRPTTLHVPELTEILPDDSRMSASPPPNPAKSPRSDGSRTPKSPRSDESRTPKSPRSDGSRTPKSPIPDGSRTPKSQRSDGARTPSSQSSLMNRENRLVFKMDLDEAYPKQANKTGQEEEFVLYREHGIFIPIKDKKPAKTKLKIDKSLNKWIQTDGPPIRPPKSTSTSTQTGINPLVSCSKKLQTRPWNLPNHLAYAVTQTQSVRTATAGTQTHQKRTKSNWCQTNTRLYQISETQTPAPPIMQESSVQAVTLFESIEVQTADEDSEIWGVGSGVSLDRLIRNEAIKRSLSMGHGIRGTIEKMRERSASIDIISDKKTHAKSDDKNEIEQVPHTQNMPDSETTGKIKTYSWNENGKFVKIFVSYSGIHLIPSKNISVKTNGINLHLTIEEEITRIDDEDPSTSTTNSQIPEERTITSTLHLNRLRRPVACLSYNVQRDMITIMLRKQKQTPWKTLIFGGNN